jgi:hypothetical protein
MKPGRHRTVCFLLSAGAFLVAGSAHAQVSVIARVADAIAKDATLLKRVSDVSLLVRETGPLAQAPILSSVDLTIQFLGTHARAVAAPGLARVTQAYLWALPPTTVLQIGRKIGVLDNRWETEALAALRERIVKSSAEREALAGELEATGWLGRMDFVPTGMKDHWIKGEKPPWKGAGSHRRFLVFNDPIWRNRDLRSQIITHHMLLALRRNLVDVRDVPVEILSHLPEPIRPLYLAPPAGTTPPVYVETVNGAKDQAALEAQTALLWNALTPDDRAEILAIHASFPNLQSNPISEALLRPADIRAAFDAAEPHERPYVLAMNVDAVRQLVALVADRTIAGLRPRRGFFIGDKGARNMAGIVRELEWERTDLGLNGKNATSLRQVLGGPSQLSLRFMNLRLEEIADYTGAVKRLLGIAD